MQVILKDMHGYYKIKLLVISNYYCYFGNNSECKKKITPENPGPDKKIVNYISIQ